MRGFKLNNDHDLDLDSNGKLIEVDGAQAAAQEASTRWRLFQGEYFLDLRQGVPFFQEILGKNATTTARVQEIARTVVRDVPGIVDVPGVTVTFDRARRTLTVSFEARYQDGSIVSGVLG